MSMEDRPDSSTSPSSSSRSSEASRKRKSSEDSFSNLPRPKEAILKAAEWRPGRRYSFGDDAPRPRIRDFYERDGSIRQFNELRKEFEEKKARLKQWEDIDPTGILWAGQVERLERIRELEAQIAKLKKKLKVPPMPGVQDNTAWAYNGTIGAGMTLRLQILQTDFADRFRELWICQSLDSI